MAVLIKFQANWADEFEVYGFQIVDKSVYNKFKETLKKIEYPAEFYFGTNEEIIIESEAQALAYFTFMNIPDHHGEIIKQYLINHGVEYGWTPIDAMCENLSEEDWDAIWGEDG